MLCHIVLMGLKGESTLYSTTHSDVGILGINVPIIQVYEIDSESLDCVVCTRTALPLNKELVGKKGL